ncbi:MAG: hypothetical protein UT55_C0011G0005 [Candidatus Peregrinibacteria bacterium GW2011_GWE2_39_6]|nr:MAG: hypothetical protein UT36_C0004G0034 [Candidatus Peregrinibacteria bacterium GW2011_GWF2_39_17]KKR26300.1 MAG: hypothetical protein UT55_C0011G0005 [Candidatus Peregrinibacteria bacterium GW2011_GWE2_39_6]
MTLNICSKDGADGESLDFRTGDGAPVVLEFVEDGDFLSMAEAEGLGARFKNFIDDLDN